MSLANYTDLVSSVADWLADSNVNSIIPDWIQLCEADFAQKLRVQAMETTDETFTVSSRLTPFPDNFLEWRSIRHASSPYEKLDLVGADWADEHYNWIATGRPKKYLNQGGQIRMVPTPDTSYDLIVDYYASFEPLTVSNPTNWILQNYPGIYLFGTLAQSAGYLGSDERVGTWQQRYDLQINGLIKSDQRSRWSGSTPAPRVRVAP